MADLTQPATAAEFQAAGADAATAAALATQHNIMAGRAGTPDQRAELAVGMRNQAPAAKPVPAASTVTPAEATAALEAHTNAQLSAHLDEVFAAPAQASDYLFPYGHTDPTPEAFAFDNTIKADLHAANMPAFVVNSIAQSLAEANRTLANETSAQAAARLDANKSRLTAMWGGDFDGNMRLVDGLIDQVGADRPALRAFIERVAPFFDPLSVDALLQVAKHRAAKR
jgi:hypothetical protein